MSRRHNCIQDPALRFWFRVYSPHRSRWSSYGLADKRRLVHEHAATVFEDACRSTIPGSTRYWERDVEIDLVGTDPLDPSGLVVGEIKWRHVSVAQRRQLRASLEARWARTQIAPRYRRVRFEIFDAASLSRI